MIKKHSFFKSFVFACTGIINALKRERNFRIQIAIGIIVLVFAILLKMSAAEISIVILVSSIIPMFELLNTSLEQIVDMANPQISPQAKIAKDAAAGMVLLASIASILIAVFLFAPKIITYFK